MTEANDRTDALQGIEGVLLANRARIVRFLQVRGAGDAAEDLFQDLWMRLTERRTGPIADPLSYVMRAANNLMLDRYRSANRRGRCRRTSRRATAIRARRSQPTLRGCSARASRRWSHFGCRANSACSRRAAICCRALSAR
ncbi:MAG: sigma-70 family RNA polymerase sigma factor [Sphingopyxis sp.]|nr:sigma-70 family RNA polymerase sigma factor [Sphingopyxis sp.]